MIEERVTIAKPAEEVYAFMSAAENIPLYCSNIVEYTQTAGEGVEVGARHHAVVKVAGRKLEFTDETTEVDAGKRVVSRSDDGPIPYTLAITMEESDGGTLVVWHQETDSYGGFFGKLADPVVTKMYARDVRANLENAKTILEG
jgi:uncharacterized protein YndB with AHSA1/START domain